MGMFGRMLATKKLFPALADALKETDYRESPSSDGRLLEFYPKGERDSYNPKRPALEVFSDQVTPWDVAGDVMSHGLTGANDVAAFSRSITPDQESTLRQQYGWAQSNEGEGRPYEDWRASTGLPAYFRGYAFRQWPNSKDMYTPAQRLKADAMIRRLRNVR